MHYSTGKINRSHVEGNFPVAWQCGSDMGKLGVTALNRCLIAVDTGENADFSVPRKATQNQWVWRPSASRLRRPGQKLAIIHDSMFGSGMWVKLIRMGALSRAS